jgi:ADP-ribose pyrophosphatase YjhB (NUDIX family)
VRSASPATELPVAVVADGARVLVTERFRRRDPAADCVLCRAAGHRGERCPGHHYAVLPGGRVEVGGTIRQAAEIRPLLAALLAGA